MAALSFQAAYARSGFVRPLAAFADFGDGDESWTMGTFTVLNPDGWIVTTAHYLEEVEKARRAPKGMEWWGWPDSQLADVHARPEADLVVARLEPFEADRVSSYPRFRTDWERGLPPQGHPVAAIGTGHTYHRGAFLDQQHRRFVRPDPPPTYRPYLTDGVVVAAALKPGSPPDGCLITTIRTFPRLCGSPVVTPSGEVWGLVRSRLTTTETAVSGEEVTSSFTGAATVPEVLDLLDTVGVSYLTEAWPMRLWRRIEPSVVT